MKNEMNDHDPIVVAAARQSIAIENLGLAIVLAAFVIALSLAEGLVIALILILAVIFCTALGKGMHSEERAVFGLSYDDVESEASSEEKTKG
jgi:predicted permease